MKEIPLTQGFVTIVDDEDFEELNKYKWYVIKSRNVYYAAHKIKKDGHWNNIQFMHQAILGVHGGDHIDGDGLNNQRSNLRPCTHGQNAANARKTTRKCTSKYKGVSYHKGDQRKKRWQVQICVNNKRMTVGHFETEEAAAVCYNEKAIELFGEFARLNEI